MRPRLSGQRSLARWRLQHAHAHRCCLPPAQCGDGPAGGLHSGRWASLAGYGPV